MPTPKNLPRWTDALWLALLTAYILAGAAIVPFHGDESTLIFMGRDYHYLFVQGDLSKVTYERGWSTRADEQRLRLMNGTISKTIYGWLAWRNGFALDDFNEQWRWTRDYGFNRRTNRIPDHALLNAARLASSAQLALAAVVFFQFVRLTLSRPTAYLASALFALHPNVLINGRRAMMEGSHLLGLMLLLLAGAWLLRERKWWAYALLGACMGFAAAAKHPNVIAGGAVFAACALLVLGRRVHKRGNGYTPLRTVVAGLASAAVIAILVFLLLNPAWWSAPFELPQLIIDMRAELLQRQVEVFGGYNSFAEQIQGFFQYVFVAEHQHFEVAHWAGYEVISAQIHAYESSGLAGLVFGGTGVTGLVCLLLAVYGAVQLTHNRGVSLENRTLILVWIGGTAVAALLLTPLPWARYYLPLAPALVILVAHALQVIAASLWKHHNTKADGITVLD